MVILGLNFFKVTVESLGMQNVKDMDWEAKESQGWNKGVMEENKICLMCD